MKENRPPKSESDERSENPGAWKKRSSGVDEFRLRTWWWNLLDYFEARRSRRIALYSVGVLLLAGVAASIWVYPWWARRNAIQIARKWLDAGQLRNAADAVERASRLAPDRPEPWELAAELARRGGQLDKAREYARRAAEIAPADPVAVIGWAAAELLADHPLEAASALATLPAATVDASPEAQRLLGEIARRETNFPEARTHFENALKVGGPGPINEVPLGVVLIRSKETADRERGLQLLGKWTSDEFWGAAVLRTLLTDAIEMNRRDDMVRWAEALRAHPRVLVSDLPTCLLALARADEARYRTVLAQLEKDHAISPDAAARLIGWLNQIGRSADAVAWIKTLPLPGMQRPPLAPLAAEAYRATDAWNDLYVWTNDADWGAETNFLRWSYAYVAARRLGNDTRSDELWRTLFNYAQVNPGHALFAASTLYSWGFAKEAEQLWWRVSEQNGPNVVEALGSLARLYQVNRDADGQYRAFRRLHNLRSQDPDIGNNFAFFAVLLGREQRLADEVSRQNLERAPDNRIYLATRAFVLVQQEKFNDAIQLLRPVAGEARQSPALAFVYGVALAGSGDKAQARSLLDLLPPQSLTVAETDLIKRLLAK